jgi:hypothetical protein
MSDLRILRHIQKKARATTRCRVCEGNAMPIFHTAVLANPVCYFECPDCGYVQTEEPYWLDAAYATPINRTDTGIMVRNQANARLVVMTMLALGVLHGRAVDCAGGYGLLVRQLRDFGIEASWQDRYCQNLLAQGFEHSSGTADLVTAFEVFEHFIEPVKEMASLMALSQSVLISTEIIADPAPAPASWWYYGLDHGQHVGFFRIRTLKYLAQRHGCQLLTNGQSLHLLTRKPVNAIVWKSLVRAHRLAPIIARVMLNSKTLADSQRWSGYE